MLKSTIQSSKTIEEAIDLALKELDAKREEVSIKILEEPSKGFLGLIGGKPAKVEVVADKKPDYLISKTLDDLLKTLDINGDIDIEELKGEFKVKLINMDSKDESLLIGKRGVILDNLQYYLTLVLNKYSKSYKKVNLNISNYREKREETLRILANKIAQSVIKNKKPIKLEPMNPYERKIIHSELQKNDNVKTFSEGEEPNRRIVIDNK